MTVRPFVTRPLAASLLAAGLLLTVAACGGGAPEQNVDHPLLAVAEFASIGDEAARSRALFVEAGRVIQHPRCLNCHPSDAHPRQGEMLAMHEPPVVRGDDNHGESPQRCDTCHQGANVDHAGIPGHPAWHLAPLSMGWIDRSLAEICEQIKDTERNGGMDMDALIHHMEEDSLVGWAWQPGGDREPAPGTQPAFGALIRAWIETGAHCPDGDEGAHTVSAAPWNADCQSCHELLFE